MDKLAKALEIWDNQAKENSWTDRKDETRYTDTANYLRGLMDTM